MSKSDNDTGDLAAKALWDAIPDRVREDIADDLTARERRDLARGITNAVHIRDRQRKR